MDRQLEACMAADRIINMIESMGFDLTKPNSIIEYFRYNAVPGNIGYSWGASRLVIWDKDYCDYVIKVALEKEYEKLCQHEVEIYSAAVAEGLADEFAWCRCYSDPYQDGDVYVPGIYVMEYVVCDEDEAYDAAWCYGFNEYCSYNDLDSTEEESVDKYNSWNCGEDSEMIMNYIESFMTPEYRRAFEIFVCKWWINDVHQENVGFKNNKMVIIDYAGWNW